VIAGDVLGERARLTPARTALVTFPSRRRYSYQELDQRAIRCAQVWTELGVGKEERVGILAENRVEYVDAFFAAGKTGTILVPLSTRLAARELAAIAADCGLKAPMYSGRYAGLANGLRGAGIAHWIALDAEGQAGDLDYASAAARQAPSQFRAVRCAPEDIYCLLYTSGTTGNPKGVMLPHRMVAFNGYNTAACWGLREDDVAPIFTPMYHAGGLGVFLVPIFVAGGSVVLHERFEPGEVWRGIAKERATVVFGVPTTFKMLMEAPEFATADVRSVRWCISGGAPLAAYIAEGYRRRGMVLKQGYGLTEAGVNCFVMTTEDAERKAGSIGKPMMFTEARLADAQGGEVPPGETGGLWLRGPHVSKGYWNNPQATAAALDGEGWFHTGDLARQDAEGYFYIAGRLKDMMISGGVNIYPAEIERELLQHPGIEDAAVVGVPDAQWGEAAVAFVVARPGAEIKSREVTNYLAPRLGRIKLPREVVFLTALPRTPYGKVRKAELREGYEATRGKAGKGAGGPEKDSK
jgi:fatty-acyl-CoA synthase